jgi:hypothetical protein
MTTKPFLLPGPGRMLACPTLQYYCDPQAATTTTTTTIITTITVTKTTTK